MESTIRYMFPLILPIIIGFIVPLIKLKGKFSENEIVGGLGQFASFIEVMNSAEEKNESRNKKIKRPSLLKAYFSDIKLFLDEVANNTITSIISVDVWAITTMYSGTSSTTNSSDMMSIGIVILFSLIVLQILCSAISRPESIYRVLFGLLISASAVYMGVYVRDIVWQHYSV